MILLPQKFEVNFDGVERCIYFNIRSIYKIQEKFDKNVGEVLTETINDPINSYKNAIYILEIILNEDAEINNRPAVTEKELETKLTHSTLNELFALVLKSYTDTLPEETNPNAQSVPQKKINVARLIYIGTVLLNRTEEEIWLMTLGKLIILWREHRYENGQVEKEITIDDVFPA